MVKRFLLHLFLFALVLTLLWYGLSRISFREIINAEEKVEKLEKELNKWTLRHFDNEYDRISNQQVDSILDIFSADLMLHNSTRFKDIDIIILSSADINAFALPGNTIVVFSGLVDFTESYEEFAGVLAHELVHIEQKHVVKRISREIGLAALFALISGSHSSEMVGEVARLISSASYDRDMETEADTLAFEYLVKADIDPRGFIDFMARLDEEIDTAPGVLQWISSHPETLARVEYLQHLAQKRDSLPEKPKYQDEWQKFKSIISE